MSEIAFRFGGTVDKVIGDSIMVFFGDPESRGVQSDAVRCVSMAIAMRKAMQELQLRWQAEGIEQPTGLRMGINSGVCKVGNFGTEKPPRLHLAGAVRSIWPVDLNPLLTAMKFCYLRIPRD
jgi:class 3 adenylate cyclase